MYVLLVELFLTKSFCIDFLVLVVSYILPFVNFDYSTFEQQSTHFNNHRLYLVFKKNKIRFFVFPLCVIYFPFHICQEYIIMGLFSSYTIGDFTLFYFFLLRMISV